MFKNTDKRDRIVAALRGLADEVAADFRNGSDNLAAVSAWIGTVTGTGADGALSIRVALLCVDDGDTPTIIPTTIPHLPQE